MKRGPKPRTTPNPRVEILWGIYFDSPSWLDDILIGACYTCTGEGEQGLPNVSTREVKAALCLEIISVENILKGKPGMSKRKAQRIAKAARHALHAVYHHLDTKGASP